MSMHRYSVKPTGRERPWGEDELIVSKTDPRGIVTYANRVFLRVAELREPEIIGQPHNIIRHPDMPRAVFKLMWDTISTGHEIFAFVKNLAASGDHYWVFAHVTPTVDDNKRITGYHSTRRKPRQTQTAAAEGVYKLLCAEEAKHSSPKEGLEASTQMLLTYLKDRGVSYEEFVFTL